MSNKAGLSISVTTGLLMLYIVFASLPFSFGLIFSFFLITSISLLNMVYAILTDSSRPVTKKFEDAFYLDYDHKEG